MKKVMIGLISTLVAVLIVVFMMNYFSSSFLTGKVVYGNTPVDCTDQNIINIWNSIFEENSTDIIIHKDSNLTFCGSFKNKTNDLYAMYLSFDNRNDYNITQIYATHTKISPGYEWLINNITNASTYYSVLLYTGLVGNSTVTRNISSATQANNEFNNDFKINNGSWIYTTSYAQQDKVYYFGDDIFHWNWVNNSETGYIVQNTSINSYLKSYYQSNTLCTSNWTAINTVCSANDTYTRSFTDANSCNNATIPANMTFNCDYDGNGIIGNNSNILGENINLNIYINSTLLNVTRNYTSSQNIELKEGNLTRITFNQNFSTPLDLKNITIKKQNATNTFGYNSLIWLQ